MLGPCLDLSGLFWKDFHHYHLYTLEDLTHLTPQMKLFLRPWAALDRICHLLVLSSIKASISIYLGLPVDSQFYLLAFSMCVSSLLYSLLLEILRA